MNDVLVGGGGIAASGMGIWFFIRWILRRIQRMEEKFDKKVDKAVCLAHTEDLKGMMDLVARMDERLKYLAQKNGYKED